MSQEYESSSRFFYHPREITHGAARIVFSEPFGQPGRWFLPGGHSTDDPTEARIAAIAVNDLIRSNTADQREVATRVAAAQTELAMQGAMRWPS